MKNKNHPMYRISSTNSFFDGRTYDSLAEAKQLCDKYGKQYTMDVLAFVDRDTWRAVYSGSGTINTGTYKKGNF